MKKFLALALALVLTAAMAVTCFAADPKHDIESNGGKSTQDIYIKYVAGNTAPETFAVDVEFDRVEFVYNASTKIWDTDNHKEIPNAEGGKWEKDTATITVINHSNVAIQSTITYAAAASNGTVDLTLTGGDATTLAVAEGLEANKQVATLTIAGDPNPSLDDSSIKIGTVTISITKAPAPVVAE